MKTKITRELLEELIKDEESASNQYMAIFNRHGKNKKFKKFKQLAEDESYHAKYLKELLKEMKGEKEIARVKILPIKEKEFKMEVTINGEKSSLKKLVKNVVENKIEHVIIEHYYKKDDRLKLLSSSKKSPYKAIEYLNYYIIKMR